MNGLHQQLFAAAATPNVTKSAASAIVPLRRFMRLLADVYILTLAVLVGFAVQENGLSGTSVGLRFAIGILFAALFLSCFYLLGLYDVSSQSLKPADACYRITKGAILATFLVETLLLGLRQSQFAGRPILLLSLLSWTLICIWYLACQKTILGWPYTRRIFMICSSRESMDIARQLATHQLDSAYQLVGCSLFQAPVSLNHIDVPVWSDTTDLSSALQKTKANVIAVADNLIDSNSKAIYDCATLGLEINDLSSIAEKALGKLPLNQAVFLPGEGTVQRPTFVIAKRLLDLLVAAAGMVFLGLIILPVAVAVKINSPGPLFYSQIRCGKNGSTFKLFKFRTMTENAEQDGPRWAAIDDPRITRVGRLLRRTRLDETPQFYNLLLGNLTLVGPRPERPEMVATLREQLPFFEYRHLVQPGITGWAQVRAPYASTIKLTQDKLQYDFFYIKNRCFFLDLVILVKTVKEVFQLRGR